MFDPDGAVAASTVRAALDAVRAASQATSRAQGRLAAGETITKGDDSPVTVADFAAQAIVCSTLHDQLGPVDVVGEEDPADLSEGSTLLAGVTDLVSGQVARSVSASQVAEWVGWGSSDTSGAAYWTLDPIDGTKGFLRGDQYAIALGLIVDGEVVLGVLGCPNLSNPGASTGAVFVGVDGRCEMYVGGSGTARSVQVADPATVADARLCESVESGHSDHGHSAQVAERLGIGGEPFRIDSQCKYAAIARGDASIYLRLPTKPGYVEKIWDHAAGKFVVEQAGGVVTDVTGSPLDFSKGPLLSANRGVVATSGRFHDAVIGAVESVLA